MSCACLSPLCLSRSPVSPPLGFVDRIEGAMEGRASQLLASDLLVTSRDPIPDEMEAKAKARGLATARTLTMRSVVLAGESMRLTEVKAVTQDTHYAGP